MLILLALVMMMSLRAEAADCKYYAFVAFGPALRGNIHTRENVYKSSGLRKYLKGFKAVYTAYDQTKSGEFELINIGPYDTEAVAYDALKEEIKKLEARGYKKQDSSHVAPAIILKNATPCE
jgi:hypothetical protein